MDLAKLVWFLDRSQLAFPRADLLGDRFEGSLTQGTLKALARVVDVGSRDGLRERARQMVRWTYVSCWHANEAESAAMWSLYGPLGGNVAVRTSAGALAGALAGDGRAELGLVDYVDYERAHVPAGNTFWPYFHKRRSFAHEREVRAVIQELPTELPPLGETPETPRVIALPVVLKNLVGGIWVAPTAPPLFHEAVVAVVGAAGLEERVHRSRLGDDPLF